MLCWMLAAFVMTPLADYMKRWQVTAAAVGYMPTFTSANVQGCAALCRNETENTLMWHFPPFFSKVFEETGYDIEGAINPAHFVETTQSGKFCKLFIVPGLDPEKQTFAPKCKFEIGAYAWHLIADLPSSQAEAKQVRLGQL